MKHLLLITTSYPSGDAGSEAAGAFVADLAEELAKNLKTTVVAPGLVAEDESLSENLLVKRYKVARLPLSLLKIANPLHWYYIVQTIRNGKTAVTEIAMAGKVDLILALWVLPSGYWAMNIGRKFHIPYSTWALGSDIWVLGKIPFVRLFLKKVLRTSMINFADGHQLKDDVTKLSNRECHFLPSTRDLPTALSKNLSEIPPYRLAFLGRWHSNKGVDILVESLLMLNSADWQMVQEVRIYGGGPLAQYVGDALRTMQQQDLPVSFGGYLDKGNAVELLLWADYVLIPSRIESIPVVFSDAMKCKCPVVCMPVGDLPRLLNDYKVGVVAENVSAEAFADAIRKIVRSPPITYADGLADAANQFGLERISAHLIEMISSKPVNSPKR